MPHKFQDTVVLDSKRFNLNTRKWNVPILTVRGVRSDELYIDGQLIPKGDYSIEDNFITVSKKHNINANTRAQVIIKYNPTNILVVFWLPIIIAAIGLIGSIGQPVLYNLNLIYQPSFEIKANQWGYDYDKNTFGIRLQVSNLSESYKEKWQLYVGVRERDDSIDPGKAVYKYVRGPFDLSDIMEITVPTDSDFTERILKNSSFIQGSVFRVKKDIRVGYPFEPTFYSSDSVILVAAPSEKR